MILVVYDHDYSNKFSKHLSAVSGSLVKILGLRVRFPFYQSNKSAQFIPYATTASALLQMVALDQ